MNEPPKAVLHYSPAGLFTGVSASGHAVTLDVSGAKHAPSPVEFVLLSLGGCTGADVISILQKMRQTVTGYRVEVSGERREQHPRSYAVIRVRHFLKGRGIDPAAVKRAVELSETKYCSVSANLQPASEIESSFEIEEDPVFVTSPPASSRD